MQQNMPAAVLRGAQQPLRQMLSGIPLGSVSLLKSLRSTDVSPLLQVKRSTQEREPGDAELLHRAQKGGSEKQCSLVLLVWLSERERLLLETPALGITCKGEHC